MVTDIIGFALLLIALFSIALLRFYSSVPAKELKRLAARGEHLALTLYRVVAYGASLRALLWSITGVCLSAAFLLLGRSLPAPISFVVMLLSLSAALIWLPNRQLSTGGARLAAWAAPTLEWVLHHLHGPLDAAAEMLNSRRHLESHSGLYEKSDLSALLAQQQAQQDSRIDTNELELMQRALQFADTKAAEIAISRKDTPMLSTSDALGPILFDELHKTSQQFFIVYRGKHENIVGIVALKDAKHSRKGGTVADIMSEDLCYVGEDFTLPQIAQAFIMTGQQVAVVVNRFEEFVGIISFARFMDFLFSVQMTGQQEVRYDDRAAVASFKLNEASRAEQEVASEPTAEDTVASPEVSEVVE